MAKSRLSSSLELVLVALLSALPQLACTPPAGTATNPSGLPGSPTTPFSPSGNGVQTPPAVNDPAATQPKPGDPAAPAPAPDNLPAEDPTGESQAREWIANNQGTVRLRAAENALNAATQARDSHLAQIQDILNRFQILRSGNGCNAPTAPSSRDCVAAHEHLQFLQSKTPLFEERVRRAQADLDGLRGANATP